MIFLKILSWGVNECIKIYLTLQKNGDDDYLKRVQNGVTNGVS